MRSYIRHPADIPIELAGKHGPQPPHLKNVSLGGLCCESKVRLRRGALVRIRMPTLEPAFESEGRVAWCRQCTSGYEVGIQFLAAGEAFRARMVEQVCHIEQYRRRVWEQEGRRLDSEEAALEWIGKHARHFPSLGGDE